MEISLNKISVTGVFGEGGGVNASVHLLEL